MLTIQVEPPSCSLCGGKIGEECLGHCEWRDEDGLHRGPMFACTECGKRFAVIQVVMSPIKLPTVTVN